MDNPQSSSAREPYEAPMVEDVPIRAEEQVISNCKHPSQAGPGVGAPFGCSGGCQTAGGS